MPVLENVIRDSVTYTEHAKRKTGMSVLLDLTLRISIIPNLDLSIYCYTPTSRLLSIQHSWRSTPIPPLSHMLMTLKICDEADTSNIPRCRLRPQATGKDPLRIRRIVYYRIHPYSRPCSPLLYLGICCSPRIFIDSWELMYT